VKRREPADSYNHLIFSIVDTDDSIAVTDASVSVSYESIGTETFEASWSQDGEDMYAEGRYWLHEITDVLELNVMVTTDGPWGNVDVMVTQDPEGKCSSYHGDKSPGDSDTVNVDVLMTTEPYLPRKYCYMELDGTMSIQLSDEMYNPDIYVTSDLLFTVHQTGYDGNVGWMYYDDEELAAYDGDRKGYFTNYTVAVSAMTNETESITPYTITFSDDAFDVNPLAVVEGYATHRQPSHASPQYGLDAKYMSGRNETLDPEHPEFWTYFVEVDVEMPYQVSSRDPTALSLNVEKGSIEISMYEDMYSGGGNASVKVFFSVDAGLDSTGDMCGDLSLGLALDPSDEDLIWSDGRNRWESTVFMSMDGCMQEMEVRAIQSWGWYIGDGGG